MESVEDVRIEGLRKSFGDLDVLHGVTFTLSAGGVYCLMAPSGSGKTTLFKVLLGLDAADAGVVTGIAPGQIAAMFQEERLCEALTPVENVLLVCPRGTRRARVRSLLSRILPKDSLDRPVSQLSGGMRRRVSLARAVAYPSRMLLLDEPFGALDAKVRKELRQGLREIHDETGLTTVFVTHDQDEAMELADLVVIMSMGRIEQIGRPQDIRARPATPFVRDFIST